jgi:hypothetical protein
MRKSEDKDIHSLYLGVIQKHEPKDHILIFCISTRNTLNISLQFIRNYKRLPSLGGANTLLDFIVPVSLLYSNPYAKQNDACDI